MIEPSRALDVPGACDLEKSSSGLRRAAVFTQPPEKADIGRITYCQYYRRTRMFDAFQLPDQLLVSLRTRSSRAGEAFRNCIATAQIRKSTH